MVGKRRMLLSIKQPREVKPEGRVAGVEEVETELLVVLVERVVGEDDVVDGDEDEVGDKVSDEVSDDVSGGVSDEVSVDVDDEVKMAELLVDDVDCVARVVRDEDVADVELEVELEVMLVAAVVDESHVVEADEDEIVEDP